MSKQTEAMKLALEALQQAHGDYHLMTGRVGPKEAFDMVKKAISALREALAEQPAQEETVKWVDYEPNGKRYKSLEEKLKDAFYEGFTSVETYNDIRLNYVDEEWLKYATAQGITKGNT